MCGFNGLYNVEREVYKWIKRVEIYINLKIVIWNVEFLNEIRC